MSKNSRASVTKQRHRKARKSIINEKDERYLWAVTDWYISINDLENDPFFKNLKQTERNMIDVKKYEKELKACGIRI